MHISGRSPISASTLPPPRRLYSWNLVAPQHRLVCRSATECVRSMIARGRRYLLIRMFFPSSGSRGIYPHQCRAQRSYIYPCPRAGRTRHRISDSENHEPDPRSAVLVNRLPLGIVRRHEASSSPIVACFWLGLSGVLGCFFARFASHPPLRRSSAS